MIFIRIQIEYIENLFSENMNKEKFQTRKFVKNSTLNLNEFLFISINIDKTKVLTSNRKGKLHDIFEK